MMPVGYLKAYEVIYTFIDLWVTDTAQSVGMTATDGQEIILQLQDGCYKQQLGGTLFK